MTNIEPIREAITGAAVIVGPALVYHDDKFSIMIAHGEQGTAGTITEIVLGTYLPDPDPALMQACDTAISIQGPDDLTRSQADDLRAEIIGSLQQADRVIHVCDSDLAMARANAAIFPSDKADGILRDIQAE